MNRGIVAKISFGSLLESVGEEARQRTTAGEALPVADLEHAAHRNHGAGDDALGEHGLGPGFAATGAGQQCEGQGEVCSGGLSGKQDAAWVAGKAGGVLDREAIGGGDIFQRGGERMLRRQAVVDVHDHHAASRKRESHQPVGVLRQDAEAAAVDVQDDRVGRLIDGAGMLGARRGHVDIELMRRAATRTIRDIVGDIDAVPLRAGHRMQLAKAGQSFPAVVEYGATESYPQALVEPGGSFQAGRTVGGHAYLGG